MRRAVVCLAPSGPLAGVRAALGHNGFQVVAEVARGLDAVAAVGQHRAHVVLVDLALVGGLGLRLIGVLRAAAPGIAVIVLNPLDTLDLALLEAGAFGVVPSENLRVLQQLLAQVQSGDTTGSRNTNTPSS